MRGCHDSSIVSRGVARVLQSYLIESAVYYLHGGIASARLSKSFFCDASKSSQAMLLPKAIGIQLELL